jgi:hypothetical protein
MLEVGLSLIEKVVAPVFHVYVFAPVADKLTDWPIQIAVDVALTPKLTWFNWQGIVMDKSSQLK